MKLTARLKALLLGGTVAFAAAQAASATPSSPAETSSVKERIDNLRLCVHHLHKKSVTQIHHGVTHTKGAKVAYWNDWRNGWKNWGNNWNNGWNNWGNGWNNYYRGAAKPAKPAPLHPIKAPPHSAHGG